jgi:hypothetical protein
LGGRGGGKGDLEKSRFDWVFLNDGVPNVDLEEESLELEKVNLVPVCERIYAIFGESDDGFYIVKCLKCVK